MTIYVGTMSNYIRQKQILMQQWESNLDLVNWYTKLLHQGQNTKQKVSIIPKFNGFKTGIPPSPPD